MVPLSLSPTCKLTDKVKRTSPQRERESPHGGGTREDRSTQSLGLVRGSNPGRLRDRRVLYPLRYAPRASLRQLPPCVSSKLSPIQSQGPKLTNSRLFCRNRVPHLIL